VHCDLAIASALASGSKYALVALPEESVVLMTRQYIRHSNRPPSSDELKNIKDHLLTALIHNVPRVQEHISTAHDGKVYVGVAGKHCQALLKSPSINPSRRYHHEPAPLSPLHFAPLISLPRSSPRHIGHVPHYSPLRLMFFTSCSLQKIDMFLSRKRHVYRLTLEIYANANRKDVAVYVKAQLEDVAEWGEMGDHWQTVTENTRSGFCPGTLFPVLAVLPQVFYLFQTPTYVFLNTKFGRSTCFAWAGTL